MTGGYRILTGEEWQGRERGDGGEDGPLVLPPPSAPMQVAREFVNRCCLHENELKLRHWRGGWWAWQTSHWTEQENGAIRSLLYTFTEHAIYRERKSLVAWDPNRRKIGDLLEALSATCMLRADIDQPSWIDRREMPGPIVATANGLLDIGTQTLHAHSPLFFNTTSVPFDYDPRAPKPTKWLAFLDALWPQEADAVDALGEWCGYVISGRLDLHKILLMVGPTRGGKGVIARVLSAMIGKRNVCGPTLNSLGGEFGLAPLIGKSLAVISDARFVGKNSNVVVERLLSISGEDTLTVNIKYREQWCGRLPCRIHVISNELPRLGDASAAIIGRLVLLPLTRSWIGKENHNLEDELCAELPGILNWSLAGLERLAFANSNRFTPVASADEAVAAMRDLASPVGAFVRERCEVGAGNTVEIGTLYEAYKRWCDETEHPKSSKHVFGRDLRAAIPSVRVAQSGGTSHRIRNYVGISLRAGSDGEEKLTL